MHITVGKAVDRNSGIRGNLRPGVTVPIGLGKDYYHGIFTALGHRIAGLRLNFAAADQHINTKNYITANVNKNITGIPIACGTLTSGIHRRACRRRNPGPMLVASKIRVILYISVLRRYIRDIDNTVPIIPIISLPHRRSPSRRSY